MEFQVIASLPAADIDRARVWYREKLGIEPQETGDDGTLMYTQGDSGFIVYPSQFAGTNQATAAGLVVKDFDAAAAELRSKGVVFEDYDLGEDLRTINGVFTDAEGNRGAWFKDPEGNILGLTEDPRS